MRSEKQWFWEDFILPCISGLLPSAFSVMAHWYINGLKYILRISWGSVKNFKTRGRGRRQEILCYTDERERRVLEYMCPLMRTRGIIMEEKQFAIHVEGLNKVYKPYDHNRGQARRFPGAFPKKKYREHFASGRGS